MSLSTPALDPQGIVSSENYQQHMVHRPQRNNDSLIRGPVPSQPLQEKFTNERINELLSEPLTSQQILEDGGFIPARTQDTKQQKNKNKEQANVKESQYTLKLFPGDSIEPEASISNVSTNGYNVDDIIFKIENIHNIETYVITDTVNFLLNIGKPNGGPIARDYVFIDNIPAQILSTGPTKSILNLKKLFTDSSLIPYSNYLQSGSYTFGHPNNCKLAYSTTEKSLSYIATRYIKDGEYIYCDYGSSVQLENDSHFISPSKLESVARYKGIPKRDYILTKEGVEDKNRCIKVLEGKKINRLDPSNWTVMMFITYLFYTNNAFWLPSSIVARESPGRRPSVSGMIYKFAIESGCMAVKMKSLTGTSSKNISENTWKLARDIGKVYYMSLQERIECVRFLTAKGDFFEKQKPLKPKQKKPRVCYMEIDPRQIKCLSKSRQSKMKKTGA